jgi:hypothetical protein
MRQTEFRRRPLRGKSDVRPRWACRLTQRSATDVAFALTAENLTGSQSQDGASFVPSAGVQGRVVRTNSTFESSLALERAEGF